MSVPGKAGNVKRPNYVKAEAYDENMERYEVEAEGLLARAICHELDHLDGKLFIDRISRLKRIMFENKLKKGTRQSQVK